VTGQLHDLAALLHVDSVLAVAKRKIPDAARYGTLIQRAHESNLMWQRVGDALFLSFLEIPFTVWKNAMLNFTRESHGHCVILTVESLSLKFAVASAFYSSDFYSCFVCVYIIIIIIIWVL
jgi:hypothetical protein